MSHMCPNSVTIESQRTSPFKGLKTLRRKKREKWRACVHRWSDGAQRMAAFYQQENRKQQGQEVVAEGAFRNSVCAGRRQSLQSRTVTNIQDDRESEEVESITERGRI